MSTTETLRTLLDGPYPETRDRVREWLSQPGNEPVDDLPIGGAPCARARVGARALLRGRHRDGLPGRVRRPGLPGPQRDRVRDARDGRPLAARQVRCPVRALRRRDPAPRHGAAPRALPERRRRARPPRLLRDDRDRSRLQRPGAGHDRDLRRRARGVRRPHPGRRCPQGLHRQRRPRRAHGRRLRPVDRRRRGARRARAARPDPRRGRRRAARRAARGLRRQARPQRRRQRADLVRPRARAARGAARPLRARSPPTGRTSARSRTPPSASSP